MSKILSLGPRRLVATPDTTGNNAGKYTATFTPDFMSVKWTQYEVYKMVVAIPPADGVVGWKIYIDLHQYEGYQSQGNATWSDSQPMVVNSGANLYFYFDNATSQAAPVVTLWVQVDLDIAKIGNS